MNKFKEGDRVVVVKDIPKNHRLKPDSELRWIGTVYSYTTDLTYPIQVLVDNSVSYGYKEENLEHLEVYESPLYKALR